MNQVVARAIMTALPCLRRIREPRAAFDAGGQQGVGGRTACHGWTIVCPTRASQLRRPTARLR
jgi:hypothetical protein